MRPPNPNEIEITIFGPGYGECIVMHVGSGKWLIVDSCLDKNSKSPASIIYLKSLGVNPKDAVVIVAASHWHDDHIKGLSDTVKICTSATLAFSGAFTNKEFLALLQYHEDQPVGKIDKGGTEFLKCLKHAKTAKQLIKPLFADTIIVDFETEALAHKQKVELRALSPSSDQFLNFLCQCPNFVTDNIGKAKTRLTIPNRNDLSVAMLFSIGKQSVLLGADLEEIGNSNRGWQAVVELRKSRKHLAHIYKIPHHGSSGAHLDQVWQYLLFPKPLSVVTPWMHGGQILPKETDKNRIKGLSSKAFITSVKKQPLKRNYDRETLKYLKRWNIDLKKAVFSGGYVTFRWIPPETNPNISTYNGAELL